MGTCQLTAWRCTHGLILSGCRDATAAWVVPGGCRRAVPSPKALLSAQIVGNVLGGHVSQASSPVPSNVCARPPRAPCWRWGRATLLLLSPCFRAWLGAAVGLERGRQCPVTLSRGCPAPGDSGFGSIPGAPVLAPFRAALQEGGVRPRPWHGPRDGRGDPRCCPWASSRAEERLPVPPLPRGSRAVAAVCFSPRFVGVWGCSGLRCLD